MKILKILLFVLALAFMSTQVNATVFVNDKAPGVKQAVDPKTGEKVWVNALGHVIAPVEGTKTLADLDKDDIAYESKTVQQGNVVIDPVKNGIKKEWDDYRKCYIWKSKDGDYLGRVPTELQQKAWEKSQEKGWEKNLTFTQGAQSYINNNADNPLNKVYGNNGNAFNQTSSEDDAIDCSKELNEILNDPHMTVSLAKDRLGQGDLTPSQKKALEQYIKMGGKKGNDNENIDPKEAAAKVAHAEAELRKIEQARAELKSLGGYDEFAADFERYEAELRATIKKYKK